MNVCTVCGTEVLKASAAIHGFVCNSCFYVEPEDNTVAVCPFCSEVIDSNFDGDFTGKEIIEIVCKECSVRSFN